MSSDKSILVSINEITKKFPGVIAVNNVSLNIFKGEVHVLVGENGAGKSTLVKILSGLYKPDFGEMKFENKQYKPNSVQDAIKQGISMIHQELNLLSNRTVAQNIFLGQETNFKSTLSGIDEKQMNKDCDILLKKLKVDIDPSEKVGNLSIAQQQMVEVAKAISTNNKLIIMDEPTSSLTYLEIENLFVLINSLKNQGVSIIYISHRMQELLEIGDRISIMRDGNLINTVTKDETSVNQIIQMMIGRKITNAYERSYLSVGDTVFHSKDLSSLRFRNVNIDVRAKEIVGIAGLVGAGRTELAKAMFGLDKHASGIINIFSKETNINNHNSYQSVKNKIAFLPEDRKNEGLCLDLSVKDNVVMAALPKIYKNLIVEKKIANNISRKMIDKLRIATTSEEKAVKELSGGNQQKVVLAKWLTTESMFFIFDEPTRGVDVGAKSEIYDLMQELVEEGAAIVMISSDLPELIGMADKIYVMKDGEISACINRGEENFTQEGILSKAI